MGGVSALGGWVGAVLVVIVEGVDGGWVKRWWSGQGIGQWFFKKSVSETFGCGGEWR